MRTKRLLSFLLAFSLICGNVTGVSAAERKDSFSEDIIVTKNMSDMANIQSSQSDNEINRETNDLELNINETNSLDSEIGTDNNDNPNLGENITQDTAEKNAEPDTEETGEERTEENTEENNSENDDKIQVEEDTEEERTEETTKEELTEEETIEETTEEEFTEEETTEETTEEEFTEEETTEEITEEEFTEEETTEEMTEEEFTEEETTEEMTEEEFTEESVSDNDVWGENTVSGNDGTGEDTVSDNHIFIDTVSENSVSVNTTVSDNQIVPIADAEMNVITLKTIDISGNMEKLETFSKWSEVVAYLNTISNTAMEYIVEIHGNLNIMENLTLPSKIKKITLKGISEDEKQVQLTYLGDIKLVSDTGFENIELKAQKYNSKTKEYENYQSVVTLNGKTFSIHKGSADFTSITGNQKDSLFLTDTQVTVTKAVSNLGYMDLENATICAENLNVVHTLTMESSTIECDTKLNVKDIVSQNPYNKLIYGGNTSNNIFTITGIISSDEEGDERITVRGNEETVIVRKNAITLSMKSIQENNYTQGMVLCNATKAGAGWFVVGSQWTTEGEKRTIQFPCYKKNNIIYCGKTDTENVFLYSSHTGEQGSFVRENSFATLQEALSEIDKLAVSNNFYRIELKNVEENTVTFSNKALTFPTKAMEVTIAPEQSQTEAKIYFKGNITLKSNLILEDILLVPATATQVALGKFSLTFVRCNIDKESKGFSAITGSGVNQSSELILYDTELEVTGAVNNIGKVVFTGELAEEQTKEPIQTYSSLRIFSVPDHSILRAAGAINIGSIELKTEGDLIGLATVTKSNGVITKVVPQITINKEVYSENESILYLDLQEKVGTIFKTLDFNSEEAVNIKQTGIQLAKALTVTYPNIKAKQSGEERLAKSGGYLTYYEQGIGAELSFIENGKITKILCNHFTDAITEINNQKTKRDYTITLTEAITEISKVTPKTLTMPNKTYISSLHIQSETANEDIQLGYLGNITFTSPVILTDVHLVQMIKNGAEYQDINEVKNGYPAAVTVNTAGFHLSLEGNNSFNTPLVLNGGNKGTLEFTKQSSLNTWTNSFYPQDAQVEHTIYGMITAFDTITIDDCEVHLKEYETALNSKKYTASNNKITTLYVTEGSLKIEGEYAKGSLTVQNLYLDSGKALTEGKVNVTNVTLDGELTPTISADLDFNITGTLICFSNSATLETRLRGAGKAPYLNINGKVVREQGVSPIYVGVYPQVTAEAHIRDKAVKLTDAPQVTAQLLTAKSALATDFRPIAENYDGDGGEYSLENTNGYMLLKNGTNIYVYKGSQVKVAVEKNEEIIGYYPSIKEASTAINTMKDKTAEYTLILAEDEGMTSAPVTVTFPSQAKKVTIRSAVLDEERTIYFSGNLSLAANTVFENIDLAPINKGKGTAFNIVTNGYNLTMTDVSVSKKLANMALKDITAKGKSVITLDSSDLQLTGSLTGAWELHLQKNATIAGTLKATTLYLANTQENKPVCLSVKGAITLDSIENRGNSQNVLQYTRNSQNVSNLTINKEINNQDTVLLLEQLTTKEHAVASVYELTKTGVKTVLSAGKKLAVMPKATTDSFAIRLTDGAQSTKLLQTKIVKADKGIYYIDETLQGDKVVLQQENSNTNCLDYTQAINEINNRADIQAEYTIFFGKTGEDNKIDTNLIDNNLYSPFTMPKANMKQSLVLKGMDSGTILPFTGAITAYGKLKLQNIILHPVKGGANETPVDAKITMSQDKTESALMLEQVSTKVSNTTLGFISAITGVKNKTILTIKDSKQDFIIKTGISNMQEVILEKTRLLTGAASTVNEIILQEGGSWDSLGKLTVNTVHVLTNKDNAYIGVKEDAKHIGQLVVNEDISTGTLLCKVYQKETTLQDAEKIFAGADNNSDRGIAEVPNYTEVSLASAKKAKADKFRAYPFREDSGNINKNQEDVTKENLAVYKDGVYVKNGNQDDMQIKITEREANEEGLILSTFYAKSLDEATTAINNRANMQSYYVLEILKSETETDNLQTIKTAKSGTGAFTLPSKAAGITIEGKGNMVIKYTGTLKAGCNVLFRNIILTEGKINNGKFTEYNSITPIPSANGTITFEKTVRTAADDVSKPLVFNSINAAKGNIVIEEKSVQIKGNINLQSFTLQNGSEANINGTVTLQNLNLTDAVLSATGSSNVKNLTLSGGVLQSNGKMTVTNVYTDDGNNELQSYSAINIGNFYKTEQSPEDGNITLKTCFTKITKQGQYGNSQLTISGVIENTNVKIQQQKYDLDAKSYVDMTEEDYKNLLVTDNKKLSAHQKLLTIPKASLDTVTVWNASSDTKAHLYKYETGVYLTEKPLAITVIGYTDRMEEGNDVEYRNPYYKTSFLTWEQAIKEIDRLANNKTYYKIILNENIGYENKVVPIANVTLPSKAAEITITTPSKKEEYGIFFTGSGITAKCNTRIEQVGFTRVKSSLNDTPITYTLNTGSWQVTLKHIPSVFAGKTTEPYAVSGSKKGVFTYIPKTATVEQIAKITGVESVLLWNSEMSKDPQKKATYSMTGGISGITNLTLNSGVTMDCKNSALSVSNITLSYSKAVAKNVTVTNRTILETGILQAGTTAVNDGKMTLKDILIKNPENNILVAKQDKNGNTQITITGTITGDKEEIETEQSVKLLLYYNNNKKPVQLYHGIILCYAQKAPVEVFVPKYTVNGQTGMGQENMGYGIYKSGKNICYGKK